jgi:hypothetical protein
MENFIYKDFEPEQVKECLIRIWKKNNWKIEEITDKGLVMHGNKLIKQLIIMKFYKKKF